MSKPIQGYVDGFEGRFVTGWAVSEKTDGSCLVKVTSKDGRELARGRASHPREDLRAAFPRRWHIGFRIAVDCPPELDELHVAVDATRLIGSPIRIGRGLFDGAIMFGAGVIEGIVTERAPYAPAPLITVIDQYERVVAEGHAILPGDGDRHRPAIGRIDLKLRPDCYGFEELELRAFANGVGFARSACQARLLGYLDELSHERGRGWLFSPDAPRQCFEIEIFRDGVKIGGGICDLPREDLREIHPVALRAGFDLALIPRRQPGEGPAQISIRLAGAATELFGGPFLLTDRAASVEAARRAANRVAAGSAFTHTERISLQHAIGEFIDRRRHGPALIRERLTPPRMAPPLVRRLNIIIPVYKGAAITRTCIESVLATRDDLWDALILVNDASPDPEIAPMLQRVTGLPNVHLLENATNLGFVGSVNRALGFCRCGDVVLLNADTVVFAGVWDELARLLEASPEIGTITPLSNNATIFSYPHMRLVADQPLADMSWADLAAGLLAAAAGRMIDVPTGHGFCLAIRREVLDRIGHLDPRFGRGYGEENDFCARAADLGWRNVAACGVLVEHRESVSFGAERAALLDANLAKLAALYPDYTSTVMAFERQDGLRAARWPLDRLRLRRACGAGARFVLVVQNWLDGGTRTAIRDIERAQGYGGRERMTLSVRADGMREVSASSPAILAVFAPDEDDALFAMLDDAGADLILVHQLMGYGEAFVRRLGVWGGLRQMHGYIHDFYCLCPRVTMLDAVNRFCQAAEVEICARCVAMGGAHEASRLDGLSPGEHRALFGAFMRRCTAVIAPSHDTVAWVQRVYPDIRIDAVPHPQPAQAFPERVRDGDPDRIILLGAIGRHKGSRKLLELAQEAMLEDPALRFLVIGYTDIDNDLLAVGNVTISGRYRHDELPALIERTQARLALFLHQWPETFSYTLSEAWAAGLWPLTTPFGAPAERVKATGRGGIVDGNFLRAIREAQAAIAAGCGRIDPGPAKPVQDR